ncbi:MAG: mannose/cellobiose epimerase-like protein (N-acyl-D-glucosamine 2-epimerase family) [Paracoccaceae bacterium]|jgi:mannose/cellobiose epimerase-like protein (N-acyl-D-glucosamine 2-epimerase family)
MHTHTGASFFRTASGIIAAVLLTSTGPLYAASSAPVTASDWLGHLQNDLLPFWDVPDALGTPVGNFATARCNTGLLPAYGTACEGISAFRSTTPEQTLVGLSRQIFSYGVAFHMTGEQKYLDYAKAGMTYQFDNAIDPATGYFKQRQVNDLWQDQANVQEQAYGLLGPTLVYYLTRDPELFSQIKDVKTAIDTSFGSFPGQGYGWQPGEPASQNLTAHLDQLNTYLTQLAETAPSVEKAIWQQGALETAHYIRDTFFDASTGMFKKNATTPDGSLANLDFGHSAKTLWFLDVIGSRTGDTELVRFARNQVAPLIERAYLADTGSWAAGYDANGALIKDANWWMFAEMDQYIASLAIDSPEYRAYLDKTQSYYLTHFVDREYGGIWAGIDYETGEPFSDQAKHQKWKAGFHSFEHALVSYIAAAARDGEMIPLYFETGADPYGFGSAYTFFANVFSVEDIDTADGSVQRVMFEQATLGATTVPLPAGFVLLIAALGGLGLTGERINRPS